MKVFSAIDKIFTSRLAPRSFVGMPAALLAGVLLVGASALLVGASANAAAKATGMTAQTIASSQIPTEVEAQAQSIENDFKTILREECAANLCTPVGCDVLRFKTLDEKQNSSLPGLDESDEVGGDLQYKLESLRCEFTFEPILAADAVAVLRQRISEKVRQPGVALLINGRKLAAANPLLQKAQSSGKETALPDSTKEPAGAWSSFVSALPNLLLILAATAGILALIWGFRRLGKPRPEGAADLGAAIAAGKAADSKTDGSIENSVGEIPSAFAIMNKQERLSETFTGEPPLAEVALQPLVAKGDVDELCRVIEHFGPAPLAGFAQKAEYRELFAEVHKRYESGLSVQDNSALYGFFEKIERMVALAKLGRPETSLAEEMAFVKDLAPDEFAQLIRDLDADELMAILSFVPPSLRAHFLNGCSEEVVEAYVQHVLKHPRISDQMVRRIARRMREQFAFRHAEIKNVSRDQLPLIEQLLNSVKGSQRTRLFKRLHSEQPALFERLTSETLLDGAIARAPASVLNDVFLNLSPTEAAAYLEGNPDRAEILAKLKAPLAKAIRDRGDFSDFQLPKIGLALDFSEVEKPEAKQARLKLNEVMKRKSAAGEVNIRSLNESVIGQL